MRRAGLALPRLPAVASRPASSPPSLMSRHATSPPGSHFTTKRRGVCLPMAPRRHLNFCGLATPARSALPLRLTSPASVLRSSYTAKQAQQTAAAAPPQSTVAERSSPKRAHENGAREGGSSSSRRRIVDVDYEARQEASAALYIAWRQHTLSTTTTSPKRALENGAQEGDTKRGGGRR